MSYDVVARLARGGMSVVDLARGPDGRDVALKRVALPGAPADVARARRRIQREAEILRSLDHPGLLGLLDVLDDGDDVVLVLPYLPGGSLADRVAHHGPLPPAEVEALAAALVPALAAAHRAGVVHRDVKPANVVFAADGRPVLADFGVAVTAQVTAGLTGPGEVVGTPAFMAPEQARGEAAGPPADVFGLGATLRWAATGEGPYGEGHHVVHLAAAGRVRPLPDGLPAALAELLGAMSAPDPARRASAAALAGGASGTTVAPRAAPLALGRRAAGGIRHPGRLLGALALVVALVGVAATLAWPDGPAAGGATAAPTPCQPLPYQPCGSPPAPHTDGVRCTGDHDDYDGLAANGCEAAPDTVDGTAIDGQLTANLVPADDVDRYALAVEDRAQLLCDGTLRVQLTSPPGVSQRVEVLDGQRVLGEAGSTDGFPATVALPEPACGRDDGTTLQVRVASIGADRTAAAYRLEVTGSW